MPKMEPDTKLSEETTLISVFKARGLSERCARIYITLLQRGSLTATELAAALHTNRMAIYRCAEDLTTQGFINTSLSTPTRYTAVPIDMVIDMLIDERANEIEILKLLRRDPVDRAKDLVTSGGGVLALQVVKGTNRALALAKQLVQHAGEHVTFVVGAEEVQLAYRAGIINACKDVARTLHTRGITDITPLNRTSVAKTLEGIPSLELRHLDRYRGLQYITVDGKTSLVGIVPNSHIAERVKTKDAFIYIMDTAFAQSLDTTFAYLWNNATSATVRLNQLVADT